MRTAALFIAVMSVGFTACSDDNDEPGGANDTPGVVNPSNVFTGEMPKSVAGATINRNSEGLVTEIRTADGKVITFDYPVLSRATEKSDKVKMTVVEDYYKTEYDMTIGSNGFVSESYVKVTADNPKDEEEGEWAFTYDAQGHLTNARHRYIVCRARANILSHFNGKITISSKRSKAMAVGTTTNISTHHQTILLRSKTRGQSSCLRIYILSRYMISSGFIMPVCSAKVLKIWLSPVMNPMKSPILSGR